MVGMIFLPLPQHTARVCSMFNSRTLDDHGDDTQSLQAALESRSNNDCRTILGGSPHSVSWLYITPTYPKYMYIYIYSWAKPTYSTYNLNNMTPGINCSELRWASGCRTFSWLEPETRSFLIPEKHCGRIWKWGIPLIYGHFKREYDDHPWNFGVTDFQKKNMYIEPVFLKIQTEDPDRRACFSRCEPTRRKGTMIFEIHTCIYIYT